MERYVCTLGWFAKQRGRILKKKQKCRRSPAINRRLNSRVALPGTGSEEQSNRAGERLMSSFTMAISLVAATSQRGLGHRVNWGRHTAQSVPAEEKQSLYWKKQSSCADCGQELRHDRVSPVGQGGILQMNRSVHLEGQRKLILLI